MHINIKNLMPLLLAMTSVACVNKQQLAMPDGSNRVAINKEHPLQAEAVVKVIDNDAASVEKNAVITAEVPQKPRVTLKKSWKADAGLSLQENIKKWAIDSGWDAPEWLSKKEFYVSRTTFIEGEFPYILQQISEQSDLNICVTNNPRSIRITDLNVSCKFVPHARKEKGEFNMIDTPPLLILEKTLSNWSPSEITIPVQFNKTSSGQ